MSGAGRGRYRARYAQNESDVARALAMRFRRFRSGEVDGTDEDAFDARALHALVEDEAGRLVCCFRMIPLKDGSEIGATYAARFYGLARLARYPGPMLELGRFCVESETMDPSILRVAWGMIGDFVDANGVELLFGCSSFAGTQAAAYADAFALLRERHVGPRRWAPTVKAPSAFRFAREPKPMKPDRAAAMRAMPPLLRSYLALGAWVSDHAVVDRDLGTLHVFTWIEIRRAPAARLRFLRARPPRDDGGQARAAETGVCPRADKLLCD